MHRNFLLENFLEETTWGRKLRWEDNIKMDFEEYLVKIL
jgi:hypothetical protein